MTNRKARRNAPSPARSAFWAASLSAVLALGVGLTATSALADQGRHRGHHKHHGPERDDDEPVVVEQRPVIVQQPPVVVQQPPAVVVAPSPPPVTVPANPSVNVTIPLR